MNTCGITGESSQTSTVAPSQESIGDAAAELAKKMNMETWQLVAILVGKSSTVMVPKTMIANHARIVQYFTLLCYFALPNLLISIYTQR